MPTAPRRSAIVIALLALGVSVPISAAEAGARSASSIQEEPLPDWLRHDEKPRIELLLSSLFADSATEGSFGLRGSWPLKRKLGVESGLSRIASGGFNIFLLDFSAKYYLRDRRRTDFYLIGGPGAIFEGSLNGIEALVHFGFGWEIDISRRLYFRPELRGRWVVEDIDGLTIGDLSLGLGWRL